MNKEELQNRYQTAYDEFATIRTVYKYEIELPQPPPIDKIANYMVRKETDRKFPYIENCYEKTFKPRELKEEKRRREEGFWFFNGPDNNIQLEYITGDHYMMLQHWPIPVTEGRRKIMNHASFRDAHRDVQYVWKKAKEDKYCMGLLLFCWRRFGKTVLGESNGYWEVTKHNDSIDLFAIQARHEKESIRIFKEVNNSFNHMNPQWVPEGEITNNKDTLTIEGKGFQKTIESFNAKDDALDGRFISYMYQDEIGKIKKPNNIMERLDIAKYTLVDGITVVGKGFLTSTIEEVDDSSLEEAKKLWETSNVDEMLDKTTESGFWGLFIPAYYGYMGDEDNVFMDDWGYSNQELAKQYHQNKATSYKDDSSRINYLRKFPIKEGDMFYRKTDQNVLPIAKLYKQRDYNDEIAPDINKKGNFEWLNGDRDSEVVWIPSPDGRWEISGGLPEPHDRNRLRFAGAQRLPALNNYVMGVDPIDHKYTTDKKQSKPAGLTFRKYTPMDERGSERFVCMYNYRHLNPSDVYEDLLKQAVFYSSPVLVENNKMGILRYFEERGYHGFLMERPESTHTKFSKAQKEKGIPLTGDAVRQYMIDKWVTYLDNNAGYNYETGQWGKITFPALLDELIKFTPDKWTDFDLFVAGGLCLFAREDHTEPVERNISRIVRKYN